MNWTVGTGIGGTFTDIVAVHAESGETRAAKVPSRPDAPVSAMLDAIAAIGLARTQIRRFVHGTTRVTNAIVQSRLPPIVLIATAGFEDVLEIGRYRRRDLYNLDIPPKALPLVPHERCFGLHERLDHEGRFTLAPRGGEGARHDRSGSPATRVHMTNTANTPAGMLEATYALRVERQSIRCNSGGAGLHQGWVRLPSANADPAAQGLPP
jgi:hypothetical protein